MEKRHHFHCELCSLCAQIAGLWAPSKEETEFFQTQWSKQRLTMISRTCDRRNWPMVRIISRDLNWGVDWNRTGTVRHNQLTTPKPYFLPYPSRHPLFFLPRGPKEGLDYYQNHS